MAANPELVRQRSRQQGRAWRAANLEKARAYERAQYAADPEKFRASTRRWAAANPGKVLANEARRRGAAVVVDFTLGELFDYLRSSGIDPAKCLYCGADRQEWDHATALALGGSHTVDNVVPSCRPCNTEKSHAERAESQRRKANGLAS